MGEEENGLMGKDGRPENEWECVCDVWRQGGIAYLALEFNFLFILDSD